MTSARPLAGWRVLVPRGGRWGDTIAARLREYGAVPVVAPLINFASAENPADLAEALRRLEQAHYAWLVIASATAVDVLVSQGTPIPPSTWIAAVGETTSTALLLAGYRVDFVPQGDNSARDLVAEWPADDAGGRALILQSDIAEPTLKAGLTKLGYDAEVVTAYRTVGVPVAPAVAADVASGRVRAILVSSGSVARQVAAQLAPLPESTVLVCIGPRTASDTRSAGLPVHVIAEELTSESLLAALADYAATE